MRAAQVSHFTAAMVARSWKKYKANHDQTTGKEPTAHLLLLLHNALHLREDGTSQISASRLILAGCEQRGHGRLCVVPGLSVRLGGRLEKAGLLIHTRVSLGPWSNAGARPRGRLHPVPSELR